MTTGTAENDKRFLQTDSKFESHSFLCIRIDNRVVNVRTVAVTSYDVGFSVKQHFRNTGEHLRRSCCRKRSYNGNMQLFDDSAERKVRRTEAVSPFADAMRFVYGDVRYVAFSKTLHERFILKHFWVCKNDFCTVVNLTEVFFTLFI